MSNKAFVFKQSFGSVKLNNVKKLTEQSFGKAVKENENRKFIKMFKNGSLKRFEKYIMDNLI